MKAPREHEPPKNLQVSSNELIPINQLKEFILEALKSKEEGDILSSNGFSKCYSSGQAICLFFERKCL